jgi:hypothetical protein
MCHWSIAESLYETTPIKSTWQLYLLSNVTLWCGTHVTRDYTTVTYPILNMVVTNVSRYLSSLQDQNVLLIYFCYAKGLT